MSQIRTEIVTVATPAHWWRRLWLAIFFSLFGEMTLTDKATVYIVRADQSREPVTRGDA